MTRDPIVQYLDKDHQRIEEFFRQFQAHKEKDFPKAKEFFREFRSALQRHMEIEEEILFPVFEKETGLNDMGPTNSMRHEHKEINKALEAIHAQVRQGSCENPGDDTGFLTLLTDHIHKEEHMIYPMFSELMSDKEREDVWAKIQKVSEDKYKGCCCQGKN